MFRAPPPMGGRGGGGRGWKTDRATDLKRGLETAREEMERQGECDHVVVNHRGRLEEKVAAIERSIQEAKRRAVDGGAR